MNKVVCKLLLSGLAVSSCFVLSAMSCNGNGLVTYDDTVENTKAPGIVFVTCDY